MSLRNIIWPMVILVRMGSKGVAPLSQVLKGPCSAVELATLILLILHPLVLSIRRGSF
jgi:hypothetical protein